MAIQTMPLILTTALTPQFLTPQQASSATVRHLMGVVISTYLITLI